MNKQSFASNSFNGLPHWSHDYSIDINSVDREHQSILDVFHRLIEALKQQMDPAAPLQAAKDLYQRAEEHFKHEEVVMKNLNMPTVLNHAKEHEHLLNGIKGLIALLSTAKDKAGLAMALPDAIYLQAQSIRHIRESDGHIKTALHAGFQFQN